jgi:predicted nucleotidyltransferase component of viral defense system
MPRPTLLIRNEFEFQDLVDSLERAPELVIRDFALMVVAARLLDALGEALCFKGGFVLRHVYGHERFSKDIDATRINPPKHKLDAEVVKAEIEAASMSNLLTVRARSPATDSKQGLDFDSVAFRGPLGEGSIAIEVSYREDVILGPAWVEVGPPYYEPFRLPVMQLDEIVAEKLRALAQRVRPTDLADVAQILDAREVDASRVAQLADQKFRLVKQGDRTKRIKDNMLAMGADYEGAVRAVAPDAPDYETAKGHVEAALPRLLP